ncbi:MAG: hypothetical protein U0V49_03980 [Saprospiraceae bacterium]
MNINNLVLTMLAGLILGTASAQSGRDNDYGYRDRNYDQRTYTNACSDYGRPERNNYVQMLRAAKYRALEDGYVSRKERREIELLEELAYDQSRGYRGWRNR